MSRIFYDHKDRICDILHSTYFNGLTYKERQDLAFDKEKLAELNEGDRKLMQGYAQHIVEGQRAFKHTHPDYKRKTSSSKNKTSSSKNK